MKYTVSGSTLQYKVGLTLSFFTVLPSAMEFLDMEKFTSILCLFVCITLSRVSNYPYLYILYSTLRYTLRTRENRKYLKVV